jgi:hypothetical protein
MNNYRYRPKDNYIHQASWNELVLLAKNAKSDLMFYNSDLKFLQKLIEVHYVKLLIYENTNEFKDLQNDIRVSVIQCEILLKRIPVFERHFRDLINESHTFDSDVLRSEFELFEDDYSHHLDTVKIIRLLTFRLLKSILEEEKPEYFYLFN